MTPASGWIHLLERLTGLRDVFPPGSPGYCQEQADGRGTSGKAWGEGRSFRARSPNLHVFPAQSSPNPVLLGLLQSQSIKSLAIDSLFNRQPCPPHRSGGGTESSSPLNHVGGSPSDQPPLLGAFRKSLYQHEFFVVEKGLL